MQHGIRGVFMIMGKIRMTAAIACIGMLILCSCTKEQPDVVQKLHVGVTCYNQSDTFIGQLISCFKDEINALNTNDSEVTISIRDASGSQKAQDDQVKELINAGCNVLCVNLVDRADPSEIIDTAREHNVPIIFFNREPVAEDMLQWDSLYYVGADAWQAGVMQGELASAAIKSDSQIDRNKDGKIQYVILEGEPGHQDAIIRTENTIDTLKKNGILLEKLSCGIANWNRAQAQNRMIQMISQFPNKIELVIANNDDMALGAIDAYKKQNLTESALPVFFGIDGTDAGLKSVQDSQMHATVYNDKEGQAKAMAKLAEALVSGEGIEKIQLEKGRYIYLPYSKVSKDTVWRFLKESK